MTISLQKHKHRILIAVIPYTLLNWPYAMLLDTLVDQGCRV